MSEKRKRELDSISDSLLRACEDYIKAYQQHRDGFIMDQLADSIQQLFKQRVKGGEEGLPFPDEEMIPSRQLVDEECIYSSQFLGWVAALHRELKSRTVSRYASG